MKIFVRSLIVILGLTLWGTLSLAAVNLREDRSSLVIWAFLGFCALIVIAQVLPAIRSARRAAKEERARRNGAIAVRVDGEQ